MNIIDWLSKVRVVEDVEELRAQPDVGTFPVRNRETFRKAEIGIRVAGAEELVAPLLVEARSPVKISEAVA